MDVKLVVLASRVPPLYYVLSQDLRNSLCVLDGLGCLYVAGLEAAILAEVVTRQGAGSGEGRLIA